MLAEDDRKLLFTGDTFYPAALYVALASDRPVPELLKIFIRGRWHCLPRSFPGYTLHSVPTMNRYGAARCWEKPPMPWRRSWAGKEPDEIGSAGLRRYEFDGFAVITR